MTMWVYFLNSYMYYSLDEHSWDRSLKYCTNHKRARSFTRSQSSPTQRRTSTANKTLQAPCLLLSSTMATRKGRMTLTGNIKFYTGHTPKGAHCKLIWILKPRNVPVQICASSGFIPEILKRSLRNWQLSMEKYLHCTVKTVVFQA